MTARSCGPRSRLSSFPGSRSTSQEYSRHDSRQPYPLHLTPQDRGIEAGDGGNLDRPPLREETVALEGPEKGQHPAAVRPGGGPRVGNDPQTNKHDIPPAPTRHAI